MKKAIIFGVTGQDGSYMSEILLNKGYKVYGIIRRSSNINTNRIEHLYKDKHETTNFYLEYGDLSDVNCINNCIRKINPDEIYNFAAMSHVRISFDIPEYTSDITALGCLRILEAIKNINPKIKYYQAGTSELYGGIYNTAHNEQTKFNPRSPYAIAKLYAHWMTVNYREGYNIFAINGILHNHTSPRRGHNFVEQKIVKAAVNIKNKKQDCLYLGNIYSSRDFGHAKDFCKAIYLMMQRDKPKDYVIATGKSYKIKEIAEMVFNKLDMKLKWEGEGINEVGIVNNVVRIRIDDKYFRPTEVDNLVGDSSLARKELNWNEEYTFDKILDEMINKFNN